MSDTQPPPSREPVRFLVFSASLRAASLNTRLARLAARTIEDHGGTVDLAKMSDFVAPAYDEEVQERDGFPAGAEEFRRRLEANDAFVIASPEYNFSMPGLLKNTIDWVSRSKPQPFNERHGSASFRLTVDGWGQPGAMGAPRPSGAPGARVFPDMFSLAQAHQAFNEDDTIANAQLSDWFERNIVAFMDLVEAAKHYPCVKKAWVEFLGEQPDPVTTRVE